MVHLILGNPHMGTTKVFGVWGVRLELWVGVCVFAMRVS